MTFPDEPVSQTVQPEYLLERPSLARRAADVVRRLGPAGPLALVAGILPAVGAVALLGFAARVAPWLQANLAAAGVVCAGSAALLCGSALMPTYAMSLLDGFVLGKGMGLLVAMAGLGGASLVGYALARWITGDRVVRVLNENPRSAAIAGALVGGSFWRTTATVTLVRVAPASTFGITNVVMSAVRVPVGPYFIGTILGMLPRTTFMVFAGAGLSQLSFSEIHHHWLAMSMGAGVSLAALLILGLLAKRALDRMAQQTCD